ncbi:FimD/PapC C-terminal domain-containing protein, partial [Providencia rettgeri]
SLRHLCCSEVSISPLFRWPNLLNHYTSLIEENATEENTGIVGDNNQLFMSGLPDSGKLQIRWGANSNQQCLASFSNLGSINISKGQAIRTISINCQ